MNSPYRVGLFAMIGALVIGGSAFAVSALGSPPPAQLPADSPVTLQTRSNDDGSFSAPTPTDQGDATTSTQPPAQDPLSPAPPQQVEPPVETYPAPSPPYDDDDDDDYDDGDDDDYDDDDD